MKKILALTLTLALTVIAPPSQAFECEIKTCVEVYVQDGRIVIEARKGEGPTSTSTAVAVATATATPKVTRAPKPRVSKSPNAGGARTTKRPTVHKTKKRSATKKATSPATSFADKLIESVPTAGIAYQPSYMPLINTPIYLWSDVPTVLTKRIKILDEIVDLKLKPTFIWHYGDGVIYTTRDVGAAFPDGKIKHTFKKPGHYMIELVTSWMGEFTVAGVSAPIPSEIVTVSVLPIAVVAAPVRFVN